MEVLDEKYHIISNGILNREDYFFNPYGRLRDCFNENIVYIESARRIGELISKENTATTVNQFMPVEAQARQIYYQMFSQIIKEKDFRFFGRIKRPPKDAVNLCISFGNILLSNKFLNIIWTKGLDPGIGMIHSTN